MKNILAVILFVATAATLSAQIKEDSTAHSNAIFTMVQQMPKFEGNLSQYLSTHITYPEKERRNNITGTVYITFVVEKDGSISGAKVLRGVANGPGLDSTALAVVKGMPEWDPGLQNGHQVRVQFNLPINFQLNEAMPMPGNKQ